MKSLLGVLVTVLAVGLVQANPSITWGAFRPWNNVEGLTWDTKADAYGLQMASAGTVYTLTYFQNDPGVHEATIYDALTGTTDLEQLYNGDRLAQFTYDGTGTSASHSDMLSDRTLDTINGYYLITMYDPTTPDTFDSILWTISGITDVDDKINLITGVAQHDNGGSDGTVNSEELFKASDSSITDHSSGLGLSPHGQVIPEAGATVLLCLGALFAAVRRKKF